MNHTCHRGTIGSFRFRNVRLLQNSALFFSGSKGSKVMSSESAVPKDMARTVKGHQRSIKGHQQSMKGLNGLGTV
jgi:hypothetical protein